MKAKYNDYRNSNYFIVMTFDHSTGTCVEVVDYSNDRKELEARIGGFEDCEIIENKNYTIEHHIIKELSK